MRHYTGAFSKLTKFCTTLGIIIQQRRERKRAARNILDLPIRSCTLLGSAPSISNFLPSLQSMDDITRPDLRINYWVVGVITTKCILPIFICIAVMFWIVILDDFYLSIYSVKFLWIWNVYFSSINYNGLLKCKINCNAAYQGFQVRMELRQLPSVCRHDGAVVRNLFKGCAFEFGGVSVLLVASRCAGRLIIV